jgi:hypothetical protein
MESTSYVHLALSSLEQTRLFTFYPPWIVSQKAQVLKNWSCLDVVSLKGSGNCRNTGLSLPCQTSAVYRDCNIEKTSVLCNSEG